ncbi:PAS domain S-box protein [Pedobacter sp.]|uniref:PAS domain S-box protein n=1 Tax=Pedobacter sp. TaxID=1411316 RepID=UPI003D7F6220
MNIADQGYKEIFKNSPMAILILSANGPDYSILDVNSAYLEATHTTREFLVGKAVFSVFPTNPTDQNSRNIEKTILSFEEAISTKKSHTMHEYRYDIPIGGTTEFTERYWTTINTPVLGEDGTIAYIIHSPRDVTENVLLQQREKSGIEALKTQRKQLYSTFMQAPVGIGIFKGPDYIVDLINPVLCKLYGKRIEEMIGKPIFEVLSLAKGQGFEELLEQVRTTGEHYEGWAIEVPLIRDGVIEKVYVDFVYEPFYEDDNSISGVIAVASEVSAQIHAKHQLEEAEERARLAADAVELGIYDLNILSGELITSLRFANIFGFDSPAKHNDYTAVIHPEDLHLRVKAHEQAIENGVMNYEARVIWKDGSIHWVRVEGKVLYDKKDNPTRILGTVLDITSQKADKELQRKLITLVDNSVDLMSIFNLEGKFTYINAAGLALLGLATQEEELALPAEGMQNAEDLQFFQQEVLPSVMHNGSWAGKMNVHNFKTGEIIPVFNNCIRIDDFLTGEVLAVGAVMRDLRAELKAKQALADSEQLLRNITTASPTALWMSDTQGKLNYVNQTWIDWSGKAFEDNLEYGWISAVIPEDIKQVIEQFHLAMQNKVQYEVEFRINHADGTQHWCSVIGEQQFNQNGEFTGYIGSCTDITEHKELQNQKDNFLGIASHELKTPVTSLKGYAQVMERILKKKDLNMEADMMRKMDAQLNRLTSLISDLLDVTKINAGKLSFNNQLFDLKPLLEEIVDDLQLTTDRQVIVKNFQPAGKIYADKDRIEQVIINFISNAIKYSPEATEILVHLKQEQHEVIVGIQDFGIGIAPEDHLKVFEQFYRVSGKMQHTFPGLGLGLYISAEFIRKIGGRIWVESKKNEGSCFYFAMPVHTA